jgi:hypothetical protein
MVGRARAVQLLRLSRTEHVLSFVFCHLIADGWACRIFTEDLVRTYRARLGRCGPPEAQGTSFAAICDAQR